MARPMAHAGGSARQLTSPPPVALRVAQALAIASLGAFAILAILQIRDGWWMQDADAYWQAALRLRDGSELYPAMASQDACAS